MLTRVLEKFGKGDTLVVVRIDRRARSLCHVLEVIERLEAKGAFFRSLTDPIDTSSPQGKFTLQFLGAAVEFERALIRERTKAGLASARTKGRVGGNPGLRARDPAALLKVRLARQDGYMERLNETAQDWVPHVSRLRPVMAREDALRIVNGPPAQRPPLDAEPAFAGCQRLRSRRLPAPHGTGPRRVARDRRSPARHRRRHQGPGPAPHSSGDLHPTGSDARKHAARADKLAADIRENAAEAGREAGAAFNTQVIWATFRISDPSRSMNAMNSEMTVLIRRARVKNLSAHLQVLLSFTGHAHSVDAR